jgi:tRNA G37 N-methylase Trm5
MAKYDDEEIGESGLTEREEETLPDWAQERILELRKETIPKFVKNSLLDKVSFDIDGQIVNATIQEVHAEGGKRSFIALTSQESLSVLPRAANSVAIVPRGLFDEKSPSTD